ncbi:ATP-binding cassette domain-containing protein [Candidatus Parabeggiatoa sp. HSG14]|uniref:ABC transporter ATP-binding protein n=1 Tax=Candidatus Parabeggiatoa sp. HSG14 TaxID=3055593 RepID=UPI0025A721B7|nr:ATP-binding cassette domain-containing protein [Thiotrichales bacterium HSG14]
MEVIKLENISKIYTHYAHGIDRLLEIITHKPRHQSFTALYPLSLSFSEGQVVGIVGNNGAGKSTLLKVITGTLRTDAGHCEVKGRIGALLELGGGFHQDMTGRENVYLSGTMIGLSIEEIDAIYDDIVSFAGIPDFMEQQVKTYSSGMFMRLAFAVATCVEPDILIIDEALSVGDGAFARKSFDRIMQFKQAGKTILFCSHSLYQVEAICDRVIWLDKGHIKLDGMPSAVISAYNQFLTKTDTQQFSPVADNPPETTDNSPVLPETVPDNPPETTENSPVLPEAVAENQPETTENSPVSPEAVADNPPKTTDNSSDEISTEDKTEVANPPKQIENPSEETKTEVDNPPEQIEKPSKETKVDDVSSTNTARSGTAHITNVTLTIDGVLTGDLTLEAFSLKSELCVTIGFASDPKLPSPSLGLVIFSEDGRMITSAGTNHDGLPIKRDAQGNAKAKVNFPQLALLKGDYWITVYLLCENAIYVYDQANLPSKLKVHQQGLEVGVVSLPRQWTQI